MKKQVEMNLQIDRSSIAYGEKVNYNNPLFQTLILDGVKLLN